IYNHADSAKHADHYPDRDDHRHAQHYRDGDNHRHDYPKPDDHLDADPYADQLTVEHAQRDGDAYAHGDIDDHADADSDATQLAQFLQRRAVADDQFQHGTQLAAIQPGDRDSHRRVGLH